MSRRAAIVEEFDDDTDLPLPSHPLPNTGSRGPLLEEIYISDDDEYQPSQHAGPASPSRPQHDGTSRQNKNTVTDITPYKTCVVHSSFGTRSVIELFSGGRVSTQFI